MTYHPSSSFLSAIPNLRDIRIPLRPRLELSKETVRQILNRIMEYVERLCSENQVKREILDEVEMKNAKENTMVGYQWKRFSELGLRCPRFSEESLEVEI